MAAREADYTQRERDLKKMKATTGSRTDHDIDDDMVDIDGDGVADTSQGAMRRQKAQEGRDKMAAREADYTQRERDLKKMKATTGSRTDHDINDDEVDIDGDGVADMSQGDMRRQKAQEGRDKMAAR